MLHADIFILHLLGLLLRCIEGAVEVIGDVDFLRVAAGAGHAGQCLHLLQSRLRKGVRVGAHCLQHLRNQAILLLGQ